VVWGNAGPQGGDQLGGTYVARSIHNEKNKKHPAESTRQKPLKPRALDLDHQSAAYLDLVADLPRQRFVNIAATRWPYNRATRGRRKGMAKIINCECGFVARGDSDDEVIEKIRAHMKQDHPQLVDRVSRDDLLGWIAEE
jgi:predicted small metal-binding protein